VGQHKVWKMLRKTPALLGPMAFLRRGSGSSQGRALAAKAAKALLSLQA
jgi:hypothetical protein